MYLTLIICIVLLIILIFVGLYVSYKKAKVTSIFTTPDACADPLQIDINFGSNKELSFKSNLLSLKNKCKYEYSKDDKANVCKYFSTIDGRIFNTHGTCNDLKNQLAGCNIDKNDCTLYNLCCKEKDNYLFLISFFIVILIFIILIQFKFILYKYTKFK